MGRALGALAVGVLAGCAAVRPVPERPAPLPSAATLTAALAARRDALHSLRALAHLHYHDADESGSAREAIVVARPDRLRVEVLSMLGSVFLLTTDHGTITAYTPRDKTVYRGPASPDNLERYARVALPLPELLDLLLATPGLPAAGCGPVSFDAPRDAVRLSCSTALGQRNVWFSANDTPVAAEQRDTDGRLQWQATFDAYERRDGVPVATRVALTQPSGARSMEIRLADVDVNPPLDNSIFALRIPAGSKEILLDPVAD